MSYGAAARPIDTAGAPHMSGAIDWFKVEGNEIVVLGDLVTPHLTAVHAKPPAMAQASPWFRVGGIPVCRAGHLAECGHATTGRMWFKLSE